MDTVLLKTENPLRMWKTTEYREVTIYLSFVKKSMYTYIQNFVDLKSLWGAGIVEIYGRIVFQALN